MKVEYTYRFVTGEEITIRVEQDELALLRELDRLEYNSNKKETRRHESLDVSGVSGIPDENAADPADVVEAAETAEEMQELSQALAQALERLSLKQRELLREVFDEGASLVEIARKEGVSKSAVSHRLTRLLRQLRDFFK
jgi:RNA polymerase sigma-70 factor (ECF subfamily)